MIHFFKTPNIHSKGIFIIFKRGRIVQGYAGDHFKVVISKVIRRLLRMKMIKKVKGFTDHEEYFVQDCLVA